MAVGAFVLTSEERARDLPNRPVYVSGFGQGSPTALTSSTVWTLDEIMEGGKSTVTRLWESSGLHREDIDLPQIYDGFSPFIYFWLEALGYCPIGEAHRFVQDGAISTATGLPIASGGGALGNGRLHGLPQMIECYLQLSGRAAERQLDHIEVGLACHASPHLGGAIVYTSAPLM